MMGKESLRSIVSHREAEIARLRTALLEAKLNMENDEEAAAYLIIKGALNRPRETGPGFPSSRLLTPRRF
jgi:hypothetical protein